MSYQLIWDYVSKEQANTVKRLIDGAFIPFDEANVDYRDYLTWLAEGNVPEPWNPEEQ